MRVCSLLFCLHFLGGLEVYKLETDPAVQFTWTFGVCEHDDYVSSLSLNSNKTHLVTAGADKW